MTRPPLLSFIRRSARLGALGGLGLGVAYLVTVNFLASLTLIFLAFAAIFGIVAGSITGGLFGVLLAFFSARYFKNGTHVTQLRRYRVTVLVMSFVFWWIFSTLILSLELAALFVNSTRALGLSLVTTM